MSAPRQRATYDDLRRVPDNMVGEIIDGELIASPRPASPHVYVAAALGTYVGTPFGFGVNGPGGWHILPEPELHLGEDVIVPDVAGWRRERMPSVPEVAFFSLAPDWVAEVLSPSTERVDRARKAAIYARAGVQHLWFINPTTQVLEVYERAQAGWMLVATHEGDALVAAPPFDAMPFRLGAFWI